MASKMAASVRADLIICAISSFQLVFWSVSSTKVLPDNAEQYFFAHLMSEELGLFIPH